MNVIAQFLMNTCMQNHCNALHCNDSLVHYVIAEEGYNFKFM